MRKKCLDSSNEREHIDLEQSDYLITIINDLVSFTDDMALSSVLKCESTIAYD